MKGHPNITAIALANISLRWSVLGWVRGLV
ncbi:superinfection immunity protein (plasmid) [Massilia litorea]|uniref:Superinfection immunity protein n=1 Tax=Massilia litorea TaxID=2769491 RepID=A0A7L9UDT7_9BURK|nr:superinfection immunity protein [Massilia litorea]